MPGGRHDFQLYPYPCGILHQTHVGETLMANRESRRPTHTTDRPAPVWGQKGAGMGLPTTANPLASATDSVQEQPPNQSTTEPAPSGSQSEAPG